MLVADKDITKSITPLHLSCTKSSIVDTKKYLTQSLQGQTVSYKKLPRDLLPFSLVHYAVSARPENALSYKTKGGLPEEPQPI